jgi:F-type H+-transporting ATPase subunit epsilon
MYKLTVITPERVIFDEQVSSLIAYGGDGYLQVLTNHCALLSTLQPGKLTITRENGDKLFYALSGGFLEFSKNVATILADALEFPGQIDIARAEAAAERAKTRLSEPDLTRIDLSRAKSSLKRAENRIKIYKELHSYGAVRMQI